MGCVGDGVKNRRSQPDQRRHICSLRYHHLLCKIPTPTPQNQQKTKKEICHQVSPMANLYLTRGDRINLRTRTLTHNRTLRPVSLSVQEKFFFFFSFFVFFSLFWDSLLLLLGGEGSFHCVFFLCIFSFLKWEQIREKG